MVVEPKTLIGDLKVNGVWATEGDRADFMKVFAQYAELDVSSHIDLEGSAWETASAMVRYIQQYGDFMIDGEVYNLYDCLVEYYYDNHHE